MDLATLLGKTALELRSICKESGLSDNGPKASLAERLIIQHVAKNRKRKKGAEEQLTELTDEIRNRLQCPICYEMMLPPIKQCSEGHPMCSFCCSRLLLQDLPKCPSCRCTLDKPSRALLLEQMAQSVKVPCKWEGCAAICAYGDYAQHIRNCEKRPSWKYAWDMKTKRWFYANRETGGSSWVEPLDCFLGALPTEPPAGCMGEWKVPQGWEAAWCVGNKRTYFFNRATGEASWEPPAGCVATLDLPPGWEASWCVNQKRKYYYNQTTGERLWKRSRIGRVCESPEVEACF